MASPRFQMLERACVLFREALQQAEALTDEEQLFIENRLLLLQLEYHRWHRRRSASEEPAARPSTSVRAGSVRLSRPASGRQTPPRQGLSGKG